MIDWRQTTYGTAPQGPNISYDDNGLPWKNIGGVNAGMAIRWAPEYNRPNTPVAIGGNDAANRNPLPPVWEEQENLRPIYDPPNPGAGPGGGAGGSPGGAAPPIQWQPNPQTPQFGSVGPDFGDGWTRQFDIGEGFSGRHKDYYDTQFSNLNAQQQAFQDEQMQAAMRRQNAVDNPQAPQQVDWSWANDGQGLPEVQVSTGDAYALNPNVQSGMTNQQLYDAVGSGFSPEAQAWFTDVLTNPETASHHGWTARTLRTPTPMDWIGQDTTTAPVNMPYVSELANALYIKQGGGTGVPAGYAMPVSGG